jgi:LysM domain-containing protein
MKWLFVLLLAVIVFGGAAIFSYFILFKQEIAVRQEQRGEVAPEPTPDFGGPEFEAAAKLRQEGKLAETRGALTAFVQKYPTGTRAEEAKDLLGEVNIDILLSRYPSPEKQEYTVKPGDVLQKIANKTKSTPELIMRMNNLSGTMLHIGDRLFVSHPQFSIVIQRKPQLVVLLNSGAFFKQYHIREMKVPAKQVPKITAKVVDVMAWRDGKRVGFGTREYIGSTRWIRFSAPAYTLYAVPDSAHPTVGIPPPPQGLGLSASDVEELSSLVNKQTAVTITD